MLKTSQAVLLGILVAAIAATNALGQPIPPPADYETWLLPVIEDSRPGAFGTLWATTQWIAFQANDALEGVEVGPFDECQTICGPVQEIKGGPPFEPPITASGPNNQPGQLFLVPR